MPADLHIHTNCSDGLLSPEDVVMKASLAGLTAISVTDHDTVDGISRAMIQSKKQDIKLIPGIEFTTDIPETEIHILGYYIDYKAKWLLEILKKIQDDRLNRISKIAAKLNELNINISEADILKYVAKGSAGRPHVARALLEKGYVRSIQEAFNKYLDFNGPAYVPHYKLTPEQAIKTIKKAGGVAVYAHPGVSAKDEIIPELVSYGLDGLEVIYSKHSDFQRKHYTDIANKHGLLVTGGSDFHGSLMRDVALGEIVLPDEEMKKLEEYAQTKRP